ncbi:hypothetical protein D3C75_666430 [compost metagenome]
MRQNPAGDALPHRTHPDPPDLQERSLPLLHAAVPRDSSSCPCPHPVLFQQTYLFPVPLFRSPKLLSLSILLMTIFYLLIAEYSKFKFNRTIYEYKKADRVVTHVTPLPAYSKLIHQLVLLLGKQFRCKLLGPVKYRIAVTPELVEVDWINRLVLNGIQTLQ